MYYINLEGRIDAFRKANAARAGKQIPFASALALSALAKLVQAGEQKNMAEVLDRPRPFTTGATGTVAASKASQQARVFVKDITARYLEPYELGGDNVLNSRALLKPVGARADLDEFGNLPRTYLRKLIGMGFSSARLFRTLSPPNS